MKPRFSRQPQSSAKHEMGVFPVRFLRKDSWTPVTDHSVPTMHVPGASKEEASPSWTPLSEAQEMTSRDALTYTFPTKRTSAECLKICRCQNGTIQHTRYICTTNKLPHKSAKFSWKVPLAPFAHWEGCGHTQYSTFSLQLHLGLHADLLLQHLRHLIRSLLPMYFENMIMFLYWLSLDSHLQGPSMPLLTRHRKQEGLFCGTRLHWHTSR